MWNGECPMEAADPDLVLRTRRRIHRILPAVFENTPAQISSGALNELAAPRSAPQVNSGRRVRWQLSRLLTACATIRASKPLFQPPSDAREIPVGAGREHARAARLAVLQIGKLRVDKQAGSGGKRGTRGRVGQPTDSKRPAD